MLFKCINQLYPPTTPKKTEHTAMTLQMFLRPVHRGRAHPRPPQLAIAVAVHALVLAACLGSGCSAAGATAAIERDGDGNLLAYSEPGKGARADARRCCGPQLQPRPLSVVSFDAQPRSACWRNNLPRHAFFQSSTARDSAASASAAVACARKLNSPLHSCPCPCVHACVP